LGRDDFEAGGFRVGPPARAAKSKNRLVADD
jgi:hypothetical protein